MHPCDDQTPDSDIIKMLANNDKAAWVHLYDKYASMLYGIILNMTGNELIAGDILTELFIELKRKKLLIRVQNALCHSLVRHTHKLTIHYLHIRGLIPISKQSANGDYPSINTLYLDLATMNELGYSSDIAKEEILLSLRAEFNNFRNKRK
jgi:hypothetical protein